MAVLSSFRTRVHRAPGSLVARWGIALALLLIGTALAVWWFVLAPHPAVGALAAIGALALLGTGALFFRQLDHAQTDARAAHDGLRQEYADLNADYSTLEHTFDDLRLSYGALERQVVAREEEREQQTALLQLLLDESRSHASQLAALNEVAAALNATLDRDAVLACILRQLERVVTFDSASVQMLHEDELQVIAARGLSAEIYDMRIALAENELARRVVESPLPVVLDDVRQIDHFLMNDSPIRGWIGAALRVGDRTVGILTVDSYQAGAYSEEDARLVANFATQSALALHNSDLYAAAERRAAETGLLLEMTRTVGSTLHLPEVLLRAAAAIGAALRADDVAILLLDESGERLIPQAGATSDKSYLRERWPGTLNLSAEPTLSKVVKQCCARIFYAVSEDSPLRTVLALPLSIKDQALGVVLVATPADETPFGSQQLVLAEGLATSAAIAIEQARLYEQARRAAQMEERSRLARELHDSVTQTLFSMTLTAEAARAQVDRNPVRAIAQIDRLKSAAHLALGEMRELLLQLRPTPLQERGLVQALRDHIATLDPNNGPQITLTVNGDDRHVNSHAAGLYRVAQEALSNVARHAGASNATLSLDMQPEAITLQVCDDGKGFDPVKLERGGRHLGLTSMAERAAELRGTFHIDSRPGQGTTLTVVVPCQH